MSVIVLAYVPVLHAGYMRFFSQFKGEALGVLGPSTYASEPLFQKLGREIRALDPLTVCQMLSGLNQFSSVDVYEVQDLARITAGQLVIMPDEDVSRFVAEHHLRDRGCAVEFLSVFLRFDLPRTLTQLPPTPDRKMKFDELTFHRFWLAEGEAERSPDWWRKVGAACFSSDDTLLYSEYNRHMPSEHSLYSLGDPRNNFLAGEHTDMSCAHHAERSIIARAARDGVSLLGSSLYVTAFPCSGCGYSIIRSGIARVYYTGGYSALESAETLRAHGVELIQVLN